LALERDSSGALLRRYLHEVAPVSMTTPAGSFYHHDRLDSVVAVTSPTGSPQWSYSYEPFGAARTAKKLATTAPNNRLRFTGELLDIIGLYHLRAGQYDPARGRFTTRDPLAPNQTDPYVSVCACANNSPTLLADPSGMKPIMVGDVRLGDLRLCDLWDARNHLAQAPTTYSGKRRI
jgi:RHS repeat-associated protein